MVGTGALGVELCLNIVSFCINVKELTGNGDESWEGVFGVVGTLRSCQSEGG
jgi:hypothetical protein